MDPNETMVENEFDNGSADDAQEDGLIEEQDESESLDTIVDEDVEEAPAGEEQEDNRSRGTSEPGWFKHRWEKEVGKLSARIRDEVRNEYEQQFAPLRERLIEMDAKELVASGKVKDLEIAKELIRLRNNQPATPAEQPTDNGGQPRGDDGRFAPKGESLETAKTEARIAMLQHQADQIVAEGGPDVIAEFRSNKDIERRVITGEMDFYDVAREMKQGERKKPPAPMRSPNGASGSEKSTIASMSDEQFERLEKKIKGGARYSIK